MGGQTSCSCKQCGGKLVPKHIAASHQRAKLLAQSRESQTTTQHAAFKIAPIARPDVGLVTRTLRQDPPLLSSDIEFADPPRSSPSAVEQDMLDHGTLPGEDLDIMMFGDSLPNLGPTFHSPETLFAVDHFSTYNAATAAAARPLTVYEVHRRPSPSSEQQVMQREAEFLFNQLQDEIAHLDLDQQDGNDPDLTNFSPDLGEEAPIDDIQHRLNDDEVMEDGLLP